MLGHGCVQEEIRFAVAPEHLAAMIISPRMAADEAIVMRGAERFAAVRGYARSLAFAGSCRDGSPRADDGTVDVEFVAIDAVDYRWADPARQFTEAEMLRELGKARAGFRRDGRGLPLATGNWGCGAFGGDPRLKSLLQWLAASASGWNICYFTFDDPRTHELADTVAALRGRTVGQLWQAVVRALPAGENGFLKAVLRG